METEHIVCNSPTCTWMFVFACCIISSFPCVSLSLETVCLLKLKIELNTESGVSIPSCPMRVHGSGYTGQPLLNIALVHCPAHFPATEDQCRTGQLSTGRVIVSETKRQHAQSRCARWVYIHHLIPTHIR